MGAAPETPSARGSRRKRLLLALSVPLLALLVLAAGELALRVAGRLTGGEWPATDAARQVRRGLDVRRLYTLHPFLNTALEPGAVVARHGKRVAVNAAGYRSPDRPLAKPPGTFRILCAGGSTTFDLQAASNEESWPWLLEERLRRRSGRPVEVWNAGAPGWTSLESAISFLLRDQDLDPDLVVVFHGYNDLQPAAHRPFDPQYVEGHAERVRPALGFGLEPPPLLARSLLLERLRGAAGVEEEDRPPAGADAVSEEGIDTFRRNLGSFVALARSEPAEVVLVTHPVRVRAGSEAADVAYLEGWLGLRGDAVGREIERLNDVTRAMAGLPGVHVYDAARRLDWRDADFADPVHFAAPGSRKLSRGLARFVARRGLLPATPPPGR
jgi:lysophospholipase L1-like esterase